MGHPSLDRASATAINVIAILILLLLTTYLIIISNDDIVIKEIEINNETYIVSFVKLTNFKQS